MSTIYTAYGSTINDSDTIVLTAGEQLAEARGKAVKVTEGKGAFCDTDGEAAVGIVVFEGRPDIEEGEDFTVQIKNIGLAVASAAVSVGDYVQVDAEGKLKKCESGFALGMAVTEAKQADDKFYVQITKSGAISGGAGGGGGSSVSFPITVAQGGTGATDAETARTNLEVDSKTNTDATKATAEAAKATAEQNKTDIQSLTERVTTLEG